MVVETKKKTAPMGYLDPALMSLTMLESSQSFMVDYLANGFQHYAKNKMVMFAHNHAGHWIYVVIILKYNKILYFDSLRSQKFDHASLKNVINE